MLSSSAEVPQQQLSDLLSGIGNHDGKAVLGLAMEPGEVYGYGDLWRLVSDHSETGLQFSSRTSAMAWCKQSLAPTGVVERANEKPLQFSLTEIGQELGQPLAGLLLPLAEQYSIPLTRLWGERMSRTTVRSPLVRLAISSCLLESETALTPEKIAEQTELCSRVVQRQADAMTRDGLITARRGKLRHDEGQDRTDSVLLSEEQREMWAHIFSHLKRFTHGTPAERATFLEQGKEFISDRARTQHALDRSRGAQKIMVGRPTLHATVKQILSEATAPLSTRDITDTILEQRERVTDTAVRAVLRQLVEQQLVRYDLLKTNTKLFSLIGDKPEKA